jgi:hypothetical protein
MIHLTTMQEIVDDVLGTWEETIHEEMLYDETAWEETELTIPHFGVAALGESPSDLLWLPLVSRDLEWDVLAPIPASALSSPSPVTRSRARSLVLIHTAAPTRGDY